LQTKQNMIKYYIRDSLFNVTLIFMSGTLFQTFLAEKGVSNMRIGYFTFAVSITQVAATLLFSKISDRVKNIKRTLTVIFAQSILFLTVMAGICFFHTMKADFVFFIAVILIVQQNIFFGMRNILEYKFPFLLIDMSVYPTLVSVDGLCIGAASVAVNLILTLFMSRFPFTAVMCGGFIVCILFMIFASILNESFRVLPDADAIGAEHSTCSVRQLFFDRKFYLFALPHFLRGMTMGIVGMMSLVWLKDISKDASSVSVLVTSAAISAMIASLVYQNLSKKICSGVLCFFGSVLLFLSMPYMLIGHSRTLFCILYFFVCFGQTIVNYAVPCYVSEMIPYDRIGMYTAFRMIITTGGAAVANLLMGYFLGKIPSDIILLFGAVIQLFSGFVFYTAKQLKGAQSQSNL